MLFEGRELGHNRGRLRHLRGLLGSLGCWVLEGWALVAGYWEAGMCNANLEI